MAPNCGVAMNHCAAYQTARKNGHWRVLMLLIATCHWPVGLDLAVV